MKRILKTLVSVALAAVVMSAVLPVTARAASYYLLLQVRLQTEEGIREYGDDVDLAGLTFRLLGQRTDTGEWEPVDVQYDTDDNVGAVVSEDYYYFSYYRVEFGRIMSPEDYSAYKVQLEENSSYTMQETPVELMTVNYGVSDTCFLDVESKPVPADSTEASIDIISAPWTGAGTSGDPYTAEQTVDYLTGEINIRTANAGAVIRYGQSEYTGKLTMDLPYGESVYEFSVISKDGSAASYYRVFVTREKYQPLAPGVLRGVSPSKTGGTDGIITGLSEGTLYEYRMEGEEEYRPVAAGSTQIEGLAAGQYYVRTAETDSRYPSADRAVEIKEPVAHQIFLPEENIPDGVEVLECPSTVVEGREFTIRLKLPENRLLDQVSYTGQIGGITISSSFAVEYTEEDGYMTAIIRREALSCDITLDIKLLDGRYYEVETGKEDETSAYVPGEISVSGDVTEQGGKVYFKEGTEVTATAEIVQSWKGYAEMSSLTAYSRDTGNALESGKLDSDDKEAWTLSITVTQDMKIKYAVRIYPADVEALDAVIEKIGNLDQYVDNPAKEEMRTRLEFEDVYRKLPLREQEGVDDYVALLESTYSRLVLRQDITQDPGLQITVGGDPHIYDGKPWAPDVTVTYNGQELVEGTDYILDFPEDMTSVGEKEITVIFIGKYTDQTTKTAEIRKAPAETGEPGTGNKTDGNPLTGDETDMTLVFYGLFLSAVLAAAGAALRAKKSRNK